jgi:sugar phosphate isomerase/epimerase
MGIRWAKRIPGVFPTEPNAEKRLIKEIKRAGEQGFSIVQLPVECVADAIDTKFPEIKKRLEDTGLFFEVFYSPLPKEVRVTERGFNVYVWMEYLTTAIGRLAELGCKTLLWDDGKSRLLPLEGEVAGLKEQFNQFVFMLCGVAEKWGITVCLEPLSPRRTNFLTTLQETVDCVALIGKQNLAVSIGLRTLYELSEGGETYDECLAYKEYIAHLHVENPTQARVLTSPRPSDGFDYRSFFALVKQMGYEGIVTLPEDADMDSLQFCMKQWDTANSSL